MFQKLQMDIKLSTLLLKVNKRSKQTSADKNHFLNKSTLNKPNEFS